MLQWQGVMKPAVFGEIVIQYPGGHTTSLKVIMSLPGSDASSCLLLVHSSQRTGTRVGTCEGANVIVTGGVQQS
eukprot:3939036-Rhodomonas_salina.2